jgi:ABC-type phosphate transport system substrate-binding protein
VNTHTTLKIASAVFLLALLPNAAAPTDRLVINGDGSTFAYPMYRKWIEEYEKDNPAVHLTYVSNGSGAGIHDVIAGNRRFCRHRRSTEQGPDAGLQHSEVRHFPTALGGDVPIHNVPGVIRRSTSPHTPSPAYISGRSPHGTTPRSPNPIRTYRCPPTILWLSIGRTEAEPLTCGPTI